MINIYWWSKRFIKNHEFENFGDGLVPYILTKTTYQKIKWVNKRPKIFKIFKQTHYFIIGSIIRLANSHTIIWGAGIIKRDIKVPRCKVLAVRGPISREVLMSSGNFVPKVYGDPAILLALFYQNIRREKKYKYAIVPHYIDFDNVSKTYNDSIKVINLLSNNSEDVIEQFLECEYILTSSLHGIIVSHALKIPCLWMASIGNIGGDGVKFFDYYYSVNINNPTMVDYKLYNINELDQLFLSNKENSLPNIASFDALLMGLIQSFPFKKRKSFEKVINEYFNSKN